VNLLARRKNNNNNFCNNCNNNPLCCTEHHVTFNGSKLQQAAKLLGQDDGRMGLIVDGLMADGLRWGGPDRPTERNKLFHSLSHGTHSLIHIHSLIIHSF
jgi:hypothetical protein